MEIPVATPYATIGADSKPPRTGEEDDKCQDYPRRKKDITLLKGILERTRLKLEELLKREKQEELLTLSEREELLKQSSVLRECEKGLLLSITYKEQVGK